MSGMSISLSEQVDIELFYSHFTLIDQFILKILVLICLFCQSVETNVMNYELRLSICMKCFMLIAWLKLLCNHEVMSLD